MSVINIVPFIDEDRKTGRHTEGARLMAALYNRAKPIGIPDLTIEEALGIIEERAAQFGGKSLIFPSVRGVQIWLNLESSWYTPARFDAKHGDGAAEQTIRSLLPRYMQTPHDALYGRTPLGD